MIRSQYGDFVGYTIYAETKDYPKHVIVRAWLVSHSHGGEWPFVVESVFPGEPSVWHAFCGCCHATVEEARRSLRAEGLSKLPRDFWDDPVIVESWI